MNPDHDPRRKSLKRRISIRIHGYSMPTVIGLLALLAGGIAALITALVTAAQTTGDLLHRRQSFYVCDGVSRSVRALAQQYFQSTADPTPAGLEAYVFDRGGAQLSLLLPDGYVLQQLTLQAATNDDGSVRVEQGVIPNGPFKDMNANLSNLSLYLEARGPEGHICANREALSLAQIGLYQFFAFSDSSLHVTCPGATMNVTGRMHSNQDFCGSSGAGPLTVDRVTAAGSFYQVSNCQTVPPCGGAFDVMLSTGPHTITSANDSTSSRWADFANATLEQKIQDQTHGVKQLKLPVSVDAPVQDGNNQAKVQQSNQGSFRLYIDPVLPTDDELTRQEKLAWKADIRIINGIWFRNDGTFPGQPIWSDHPGNYVTSEAKDGPYVGDNIHAGQDDFGYASPPQKYSYYEYIPASGGIENGEGVISYGTLGRADPTDFTLPYKPSFWENSTGSAAFHTFDYFVAAGTTTPMFTRCDAAGNSCAAPIPPHRGDFLLEAARSGFIDHRVRHNGNGTPLPADHDQARILPINFDVGAFADALLTVTNNELGSHFTAEEPFNGIVWIGSYWNGQLNGFGGGLAQKWPHQGNIVDPTQIPNAYFGADTRAQNALPFPLCSDSLTGAAYTASTHGGASIFKAPSCFASDNARPNALRIYNAAQLSTVAFPKGLTISTNLPVYLMGNTNQNAAVNWVPMQVAGDSLTLLSNAWTDGVLNPGGRVDWASTAQLTTTGIRDAAPTSYRVAIFAGAPRATPSNANGRLLNFPRFMEHWQNIPCVIQGAMVDGFNSVFQDHPWEFSWSGGPYRMPNRLWSFDPQLQFVANQPPGSPIFDVSAVRYWKRE